MKRIENEIIRRIQDHVRELRGTEEQAVVIRYLLADIRHLCDARGFGFASVSDLSYQVYLSERQGIAKEN